MVKCYKIGEIRAFVSKQKLLGKRIGLVPTMGALHQGHARLVRESVENNDVTVASIFVNPIQFNKSEDLDNYPVQMDSDCEILKDVGCDIVFIPSAEEMYQEDLGGIEMNFGEIETVMEGAFRPGHFSGVGVVVSKLFNIVQPDISYFGQKDLQQLAIIKKMVSALNFNVKIIGVSTYREESGLAMSSRNLRLTDLEKEKAAYLYQAMKDLKSELLNGVSVLLAVKQSKKKLLKESVLDLEYLEVVDTKTLMPLEKIDTFDHVSICGAAHIAGVRIIDNIYVKNKN